MNTISTGQSGLFEHAPPTGLQRHIGLVTPDQLNIGRRVLLVVLIGWVPLVLLTLVASVAQGSDGLVSLFWQTGVHTRYLIAAPLLILAEAECASRLNAIVHQFVASGLVPDRERKQFEASIESTRGLLGSTAAEFAVFVLAYLVVASVVWSHGADEVPIWHKAAHGYSLAGWWHVLVSMPMLLVLVLGWMWRLALWTRLLGLIARLDLRLVASHPDHAAGLGFVGHSLRAFSVVALALSAIAAGKSAHIVLTGGGLPTPQFLFNVGLLVAIAALFTAPLLVFTPTLLRAWRRGVSEYGALAKRVGDAFEDKWFRPDVRTREDALDKPDFSATADLYSVVSNVYSLRLVPVDLNSLIVLVAVMLIPFVPVGLLAVPLDTIWSSVKNLLF